MHTDIPSHTEIIMNPFGQEIKGNKYSLFGHRKSQWDSLIDAVSVMQKISCTMIMMYSQVFGTIIVMKDHRDGKFFQEA